MSLVKCPDSPAGARLSHPLCPTHTWVCVGDSTQLLIKWAYVMLSYTTALVTGTCCNQQFSQQFSCSLKAQLSLCLLKASLTHADAKHHDSGVSRLSYLCAFVCVLADGPVQRFWLFVQLAVVSVSRDESRLSVTSLTVFTHYCLSYTHSDNQPAYWHPHKFT